MSFLQAMGIPAAGAFSTCVWTSVCDEQASHSGRIQLTSNIKEPSAENKHS